MFLRDQLIFPWQVASSWWVAYDPNDDGDRLSPKEEEQIQADIAAERLGEGDDPADRVSDYWNDDTDERWRRDLTDDDTWSEESEE